MDRHFIHKWAQNPGRPFKKILLSVCLIQGLWFCFIFILLTLMKRRKNKKGVKEGRREKKGGRRSRKRGRRGR
jgi:hypothetical protein